jgi:hypothetical protein
MYRPRQREIKIILFKLKLAAQLRDVHRGSRDIAVIQRVKGAECGYARFGRLLCPLTWREYVARAKAVGILVTNIIHLISYFRTR